MESEHILRSLMIKPVKSLAADLDLGITKGIESWTILRWIELQEVAEIASTAAVKEAVKEGIGIPTLSRRAVLDDVDCGRLATVAIKGHKLQQPFF